MLDLVDLPAGDPARRPRYSEVRGYQPGRFSFNVKGGRCEVCRGARYNRDTLEVHYKGKTISEVLDLPIEQAAEFFAPIERIARHLRTLVAVGLGYVIEHNLDVIKTADWPADWRSAA